MAQAKKRKKFFDVSIPIIKKETQLYGYEIEELNGRIIVYDLTRLLRGKSILLKLKVTVEGGKAIANPCELKIMPYFIRRMMRKGTNYVEDSFLAECKNSVLRIKPFLITRKKVSRAVRKALRDKAREELTNYIKEKTTEILFDEIIKNKIQKPLVLRLKKIYPLSLCEIRVLKIEKFKEKEEKPQKK
jgi:ribosomal protein S3AE